MRPLEILIALTLGLYLGWTIFSPRQPRWVKYLPFLALLLTLAHLAIEHYRWQMIPLYLLTLVSCLAAALRLLRPGNQQAEPVYRRFTGSILKLLVFGIALTLPILLPVPRPPPPSGPYKVGTLTLYFTDTSRKELYGDNPNAPRELVVQFWYPAVPLPGSQPSPWMEEAEIISPAIARWIGMPPFILKQVTLARTNSYRDAPMAQAQTPFPVLLFSHGWGGFRSQNTYQVEQLASQGYVVVAVQHTYGAIATVFPDGRLAMHNPNTLPRDVSEAEYLVAANKLANQWAGDLGYVLDQLEVLNANDPGERFNGRLDLQKVGVFGHSMGGGTAVEFCGRDARCKAALGMDAYMIPVSQSVLEQGLAQPALFMFSETWPSAKNTQRFDHMYHNMRGPVNVFTILGTSHYDFSDLPMLSPLASRLGLKGPLEGKRVLQIVNDYSLAFFDQYLKGVPTHLLDGPSGDYPEVIFR